MTFEQYIELLATTHQGVRHSDEECHFSALADDGQNSHAHKMHYPCIVVDGGDFDVQGDVAQPLIADDYSLLFLTHVKDPGNSSEVLQAFASTREILMDFLKKMLRDKAARRYTFLNRFSPAGCSGHRIYLQGPSLYGWVLMMSFSESLNSLDCNNAFTE